MPSKLQTIAERLNISTSTVSRALNGKPGVSDQVRKRIFDIAQELNIVTDPAAQIRATSKSLAIGFVIRRLLTPVDDDAFYDRIMKAAGHEFAKYGYHLASITIDPEAPQLPLTLDKGRLDGLLIAGPELPEPTIQRLLSLEIPTVLVANRKPYVAIDSVTSANEVGGYWATKHLLEHGHTRVACISGPQAWSPVGDRVAGYHQALREKALSPLVVYRPGYLTVEMGCEAMQEILEKHPDITAVFCANDPMAVGAIKAVYDAGGSVPNDIAVVGFDNIPWAKSTVPPLTTINIHKQDMGLLAARRLLELIQNGDQVSLDIQVKNELIVRQSCGCQPENTSL